MVFVAISPNVPPVRNRLNARREEVRHQVSVAMALGVRLLQPIRISVDIRARYRILARERWVADDGIEARIRATEHLGELDLPMERREGRFAASQASQPTAVLGGLSVDDLDGVTRAQGLAFFRLRPLEERGQNKVP